MVAPLADNAFYFHGITSPGNSPNAPQVAQASQAVPATADRVEISNAAEDVLRSATGTPSTTDSPESKDSTAESAGKMPAQTSGAAQQPPTDEARERQIQNISAVYQIAGDAEGVQANIIDGMTDETIYQLPTDTTVEIQEQFGEFVGQIFDTLM